MDETVPEESGRKDMERIGTWALKGTAARVTEGLVPDFNLLAKQRIGSRSSNKPSHMSEEHSSFFSVVLSSLRNKNVWCDKDQALGV